MSTAHDLKLVTDPPLAPASQGSATVLAVQASGYLLSAESSDTPPIVAQRAASCRLEPALGDRVWFVCDPAPLEQRRGYVIAVLEREAHEQPAQLSIDGNAELRANHGQLTIRASEGLELLTDRRLGLQGDEVQVHGRLARVLFDECSMVLRSLFSHVSKSTFVGKIIETLAEKISTHSKTSHRTVEDIDQVAAGTIHYRATHSAQLGAEHTLISGGELVKVDGGQIHLG